MTSAAEYSAALNDLQAEQSRQLHELGVLRALGFTEQQAWSLARAGYGVVDMVPLGWAALPIDEHLGRIEAATP